MYLLYIVLIFVMSSCALAAEQRDITVAPGIELNNYIAAATGLLALILFIITLTAYQRTRNKKLIYVAIAFGLFAIKGFMIAADVLIKSNLVDPVAYFLDFAILLSFFLGIIKK